MAFNMHTVLQYLQIPYVVSCGTALGVERHQGFMAWDYDHDFNILIKYELREQYYNKIC